MVTAMHVLGLDAYRKGWVAVVLADGRFDGARVFASAPEAVAAFPEAAAVAVDIPIGLPVDAVRAADVLARRFVGRRASSVFTTPPRAVFAAATYADARRIAVESWVQGVSSQAYRLGAKVLEVEALARADGRIHEVHPEVSFCALAGRPLTHYKKTWNGQMERRRLLAEAGIEVPDALAGDVGRVPPDDILDAAVAAWSAHRIARGEASSLPDPPEVSRTGYPMAMGY